jgi:hypothetical protein
MGSTHKRKILASRARLKNRLKPGESAASLSLKELALRAAG